MANKNVVLEKALLSAKYNFIGQILFKIFSFVLNTIIIRFISKEILGIVNVRLMLLNTTVIFLSSEGFKRACLTNSGSPKQNIINVLWIIPFVSILLSICLSYIWINVLIQPNEDIHFYNLSVKMYALSAIIESTSQIFYTLSQICHFMALKVYVESTSLIIKNVCTIFLIFFYPQFGLLIFAFSQILYASIILVLYLVYFIWHINKYNADNLQYFKNVKELFPTKLPTSLYNMPLMDMVWTYTYQSFLKQILTEGERYVMTFMDVLTFTQQGIYDLVNNLASLVARLIYLPLEESAYFYFTQTKSFNNLNSPTINDQVYGHNEEVEFNTNQTSVQKDQKDKLIKLLSLVTIIGTLAITFGFAYSEMALRLFMGTGKSQLSSAVNNHDKQSPTSMLSQATYLLDFYCIYLIFLGINGITECFMFATFKKSAIDKYNRVLVGFSLIFLCLAVPLGKILGPVGLVLANTFNMLLRILYSSNGISQKLGLVPKINEARIINSQNYQSNLVFRDDLRKVKQTVISLKPFFSSFFPRTSTIVALIGIALCSQLSNIFVFHYTHQNRFNFFTQIENTSTINYNQTGFFSTSPTLINYLAHTGIGFLLGLLALYIIYKRERSLINFIKSCYGQRHQVSTQSTHLKEN